MRLLEDGAASSPSLGSPQARAPYQGSPRQETGLLPLHHPAWPKHPRDTKVGLPRLPFLPVPPCPDPRNQAQGAPLQVAPVPAPSSEAAAPSPIQAKERAKVSRFLSLGSAPGSTLCRGPRQPVQGSEQGAGLQAFKGACESRPLCFLQMG